MEGSRELKVFSGTPNDIREAAGKWMAENKGKVDVVAQKLKLGKHTGSQHWNPTGVLSIIYRRYRE